MNIFRSDYAVVYPAVIAISVRYDRKRTALLDVQFWSFFNLSSSPAAVRRRTYVFGRQIFLPSSAKTRSILIKTTVGALRDTARARSVTVLPRELVPTDAFTYLACIYPSVALLVSITRLGKSVVTRLNFDPDGSSERMAS